MKNQPFLYSFLLGILISSSLCYGQNSGSQYKWDILFDGGNLDQWYTYLSKPHPNSEVQDMKKDKEGNYKEHIGLNKDPLNVFSVVEKDGEKVIRISGEVFGTLITKKEFENYHLSLEFKAGKKKYPPRENKKKIDSGILYHSVGPEGAWEEHWMRSFEYQVKEGSCGDFITIGKVLAEIPTVPTKPKRPQKYQKRADMRTFHHKAPYCRHGDEFEKPKEEWNTIDIYMHGDTSIHLVNGKVNLIAYNLRQIKDGKEIPLTKGKVQIQSEGGEIFYRNIKVSPIKGIPKELMP